MGAQAAHHIWPIDMEERSSQRYVIHFFVPQHYLTCSRDSYAPVMTSLHVLLLMLDGHWSHRLGGYHHWFVTSVAVEPRNSRGRGNTDCPAGSRKTCHLARSRSTSPRQCSTSPSLDGNAICNGQGPHQGTTISIRKHPTDSFQASHLICKRVDDSGAGYAKRAGTLRRYLRTSSHISSNW